VARALTFPVLGPAEGEWPALDDSLHGLWRQSTDLANWAAGELFLADVLARRAAKGDRIPPFPCDGSYLYRLLNEQPYTGRSDWEGATQSASQILTDVYGRYKGHRKAVIWSHGEQPAAYRYPYPYPVPRQRWEASLDSDGFPVVSVSLPGQRVALRLRGIHQGAPVVGFAAKLAHFRAIVSGERRAGVLYLSRQRCSAGCHRHLAAHEGAEGEGIVQGERAPGGGQRVQYRTLCRIVVWLPRAERKGGNKLLLRTDANAFWTAEHEGRFSRPWILNADHVRQPNTDQLRAWMADHDVWRQRMSEDLKHEKRWPRAVRQVMNDRLERRCGKVHRQVETWCHQAVALVANYARRQGVDTVLYDDSERSYLPHFPWARLSSMLRSKLELFGVAMEGGSDRGRNAVSAEGA